MRARRPALRQPRAVSRRRRSSGSRSPASPATRSAPPPSTTVLPLGLPDLPFHLRLDALSAFFLLLLGAARRRDLALFRRLFPLERRNPARPHLLPVPRLPRGDGARARRRRRVRVHGGLGIDGALVVLPRHDRAPHSGDPPRRLPVPRDRARRRDRDPALLRRAAGRQRRLHVRLDALGRADRRVADGRVLPRARRLRRQGRPAAAARLAARGASGGAVARLGADERRDAEDGDLRPAARRVRPPPRPAVVVGRGRARARPRDRALRRRLRRRADGHEAAARLLVDREHRHHRRRHRPRHPVQGLRQDAARGDHAHGRAVSLAQPRVLQEPAVPRDGLGAARDARAKPRQARRAHPPDAVGRVARAGRHAGGRRHPSAQRLRFGMAAAAGVPVHAEPAAVVRQHAGAARRRRARAVGGARRLRDGQVLRRRVPRPAAGAESRLRAGRRPVRALRAHLSRRRLRAARRAAGQRDRAHRAGQRAADRRDDDRARSPTTGCCSRRSAPTARATARSSCWR